MPVYERSTHVDAPFAEVWDFHSRASGLEALTPDWMHMRVDEIRGPDGEPHSGILEEGSEIEASVQPFGFGPRQHWTSEILDRREEDGRALFRDRMVDGPFASWEHTHRFSDDGDGTTVHDRIEYEVLGGPVGLVTDPLAVVGLAPMFHHRHRQTRALLE